MHDSTFDAAVARGALIVTPNKRLAREIAARHDRAQLASGRAAWPAAKALPWPVFAGELMQAAQDAGLAVPMRRLDAAQGEQLWRTLVSAQLADAPLVNADAAARLAVEAWERVHAYGSGAESWRGFAGGGPDVEAFARWAEAYRRETARLGATDGARIPDALVPVMAQLPGVAAIEVVLAGFIELSPQQERLLRALEGAGALVTRVDAEPASRHPANVFLAEATTPDDELAAALDWAREHALRAPEARIGIVVLDLAQRAARVRSLADDRLCAALQWPGHELAPRPYEVSVGGPLGDVALVASALDLVALGHRPLPRARLAMLLRSPYLPGPASAWPRRAALERGWLEQGTAELAWQAVIDAVAGVDATLAARWRQASRALPPRGRATPRAWVEHWRAWLTALGWCEGRALDSGEHQAEGAWNDLLGTFARLSAVAPQLSRDEALSTLVRLAREQMFQPEAPGARIRILGLLEASGLRFDALWVAGMAANAWPQSPEPNPLLPIRWQREHGVPRASPERELAFARQLTAMLSHAAPVVVFSYAAQADDHSRAPSPLVASLPRLSLPSPRLSTEERAFVQRPALDHVDDERAPPVAAGSRLSGGAGMIDAQSACPFRAMGIHRLRADAWPAASFGLSASERGSLVHGTLAAFWDSLREQSRLAAMTEVELDAAIAVAFQAARTGVESTRWRSLPPAVAASEAGCVHTLVRQWLVEVERARPPFSVLHVEARATTALAGYPVEVRLDRVDAIGEGVAVLDYKTGVVIAPPKWFDARPQGAQLALYAMAQAQRDPSRQVRALAYGRLRPGEVAPIGLAADAAAWPALTPVDAMRGVALAGWGEAMSRLDVALTALAHACGAGEATVTPREPKVCTHCHLQALCRIGAIGEDAGDDGFEADDDA